MIVPSLILRLAHHLAHRRPPFVFSGVRPTHSMQSNPIQSTPTPTAGSPSTLHTTSAHRADRIPSPIGRSSASVPASTSVGFHGDLDRVARPGGRCQPGAGPVRLPLPGTRPCRCASCMHARQAASRNDPAALRCVPACMQRHAVVATFDARA